MVLALIFGLVLAVAAPSPALTPSGGELPPKVKPARESRTFHTPQRGSAALLGDAARLGFCGGDDWEPEVAAAPDGLHVYVVIAHFPGDPSCDPASGNRNRVYIQVSSDGGQTFSPPHLAYGVQGVDTDVAVAKSTDFGQTFTAVKVNGPQCKACDHPWLVAYDDNVYVTYAHLREHFLSRSSDGGATWTESLVLTADAVAFPEGAVLDSAHNAWFAWGDCKTSSCNGNFAGNYRVSRTLAGTSNTTFALVASAPAGPKCPHAPNCGFAYFGIQNDIAIDAAGNFYMVWQDGQDHSKAGSPPIVQLSRCRANRNCTVSANWAHLGRVDDKTASGCANSECYALFPRVEGGAANQIAAIWMDDRLGAPVDHTNGWNVWLRTSTTGGTSWTGPSRRVSQFDPSRKESQPHGFLFPYGDYHGIDIRGGEATMAWGEGVDYTGGPSNPGHVIYRSMAL
jgi:hypothetical protein